MTARDKDPTAAADDPVAGHTFDMLSVGDVFTAGPRIISREDVATFATLTGDFTALHTDEEYATTTPLGGLVAHGALTLSVATGLAYECGVFRRTVLAFRSLEAAYEKPVFPGDAVRLRLEVTGLRARDGAPHGRVTVQVAVLNQDDKRVLSGTWTLIIRR